MPIGSLIGLSFALMTLAQMNLIDLTVVVSDVIGHGIWGGLTGGSVAWFLCTIKSKPQYDHVSAKCSLASSIIYVPIIFLNDSTDSNLAET